MILFDLRCGSAHVFEAWFASSAAYEQQRGRGQIACPVCGVTDVGKAVMAPNVAAKGNAVPVAPADRDRMRTMLARIAAAQAEALATSTWVGRRFAKEARAMHDGERDAAPIHGQATPAEARALIEEGVQVAPLLVPVTPPEQLN